MILPQVISDWVLGSRVTTDHPDESKAIHRLMNVALWLSRSVKDDYLTCQRIFP